ncbi:serine/threonine-protein kinase [Streptomyces monticola]|uniref:non-specific serine/threonine protein kinase n=1 Tax=Streptomyces monticola TaxID=2666263 RepID=A0ABW2JTH8_9ACTN
MNGDGGTGGRRAGSLVEGRFELLEKLGSGGMGTVWRARDLSLHREVALKEVRPPDPSLTADERHVQRERVLREARALARLNHPHVVTVHQIVDTGEDAHPWIVMELLSGRTLQDRLDEGVLEPREAARIGLMVLSALRAAHAAGIHHRDVKPANIMLREDGSAVLTDFGIAALQGATALTAADALVGSPEYMAPERVRGTDNDPASDLWSLGLVLYAAVEGISPMRRSTTLATLTAVLEAPVPPSVHAAGPLAPVLRALLVRDPAARPDADRLEALLRQAEAPPIWAAAVTSPAQRLPGPPFPDSGAAGPTAPEPRPVPRSRSRTPVLIAVIAVAVAVVAATALVFALRDAGKKDPGTDNGGTGGTGSAPATPGQSQASPSHSPSQSPSATPTPTTSPPTTSAPPQDPTPLPAAGRWVAQLASVPKSAGTGARDRQLAALRAKGADNATYLESGAYDALKPGYWMLYSPGFANGEEAVSYCQGIGLTTKNQCVGRYVSDNAADRAYICAPTATGTTTGRCTRP